MTLHTNAQFDSDQKVLFSLLSRLPLGVCAGGGPPGGRGTSWMCTLEFHLRQPVRPRDLRSA